MTQGPVSNNSTITTTVTSDDYWSATSENSKFAATPVNNDDPSLAIPENGNHDPATIDLSPDTDLTISAPTGPRYKRALNIMRRILLLNNRKNLTAP
jgi:hypothetical protein